MFGPTVTAVLPLAVCALASVALWQTGLAGGRAALLECHISSHMASVTQAEQRGVHEAIVMAKRFRWVALQAISQQSCLQTMLGAKRLPNKPELPKRRRWRC